MISRNTLVPFWILTVGIVLGFTLPVIVQDAMFQDGVLYSAVAHNLAKGVGTFWFPQFSALNIAGIASFHEQPPLVFGIQSLFYRILGDSIYVERFYILITLIAHMLLINMLWKLSFDNNDEQRKHGWIAVIFWILIPVCWWCFHNNLIENTMSLFDLAAIIIIIRNLKNSTVKYGWILLAGVMIFLASFSKGIPGLFPVVAPLMYWAVYRDKGLLVSISYTVLLALVPVLFYSILLIFPASRESLSIYFFERLLSRVDSMPTASYRFEIVWRLFTELIPVLLSIVIVLSISWLRKRNPDVKRNKKPALLFLLIGLSASVPLALTMVQKGWYLVPSFPYFAISAAMLISPYISMAVSQLNSFQRGYRVFYTLTVVFLLGVLIVSASQVGKISREKETLCDVYKIGEVVPANSTITVPKNVYNEYDFILQGFLVRHFGISIDPTRKHQFFLNLRGNSVVIPDEYALFPLQLDKYELFIRKD